MRTISCWIQHADFTAKDLMPLDADAAVALVTAHDWVSEWRMLRELGAAGGETCPPGVGFVGQNGAILHICPGQDGPAMVHYHFKTLRRWLGFIQYSEFVVQTTPAIEWPRLPEFVRRFYENDHAWLVKQTASAD
jgi:hypothetical protein